MKECRKCGEVKPLHSFPNAKRMKDGKSNWCHACENLRDKLKVRIRIADPKMQQLHSYFRKYGLSHQDVKKLFESANHQCQICGDRKHLRIDHDHKTGNVRGILCSGCNTALGTLGDTVEGLMRAVQYLQKAPTSMNMLVLLNQLGK